MKSVRQRKVFYVSGFDPKGAAYYHSLYRSESLKRGDWGDFRVETVGPRARCAGGNSAWRVNVVTNGETVTTDYEFMAWDHIVRRYWPKTTLTLWLQILSTTWFNLQHRSLWAMFKLSWPPAVALFSPFLLLVGSISVTLMMVLGGIILTSMLTQWWIGVTFATLGPLLWLIFCRLLEQKYSMYWMMRSYAFTAKQARGEVSDLETCLDQQAERLAKTLLSSTHDEVLVVGHSSGAIMATIIVSRALRIASVQNDCSQTIRVSLLTLGQWIPLLGLLPMANDFRHDLKYLSDAEGVHWIDFSAPPDGCCFALTDPLTSCGIPRSSESMGRFKLLNPRFIDMHGSVKYQEIKRDKLALHFQYLSTSTLPSEYDFIEITAGNILLWERFAERKSVGDFTRLRARWPFS